MVIVDRSRFWTHRGRVSSRAACWMCHFTASAASRSELHSARCSSMYGVIAVPISDTESSHESVPCKRSVCAEPKDCARVSERPLSNKLSPFLGGPHTSQ